MASNTSPPPEPAPHALPELAAARDPAAPHVLHHDLETRSKVDLKAAGAVKYASDPTTEVLCLHYAVDDEPVQSWARGDPVPAEFIEAERNPLWTTGAHNDAFERVITQHVLEVRHGFPAIPLERRRCSMAMAYAAALPGSLEKVVEALGLPYPKDKAGQALMRRMSKPLPGGGWIEDAASLERLSEYCRRDVEAERAVYKALPPLTAEEQQLWALDAVINARGFAVDGELLEAAHRVATAAGAKLQAEFRELTSLDSTNQVEKFVAWLGAHDCVVTDVQKGTLHHALRRKSLTPQVRRAIELRLQLAHASAAKIEALLAWRGTNNRVRGSLVYHGASTGRWSARGPQPQNFKRDSAGIDAKISAVLGGGGAGLESPVEAVGDIARGMIVAAPGHRFLIGDYSGIESRGLAWISGQLSKLEQWAKYDLTGALADDPYYLQGRACGLAEDIARAKGKICDLAFGYQGGAGAWKAQAPDDDPSTDEDIKRYQQTWRARHPHTVGFWTGIDRNAVAAVRTPGKEFTYKRLRLVCDAGFLRITLPSGRALSYPFPRIVADKKYGDPRVVFKDASMGKWSDCRFGHGAYGGLWTENVVSAMARDVMAGAMLRLEAAGYRIVLTVHDEIIAEVPDGFGSLEEFRRLLTAAPDWVDGNLPIAAKVRESQRFSKPDSADSEAAPEAMACPLVDVIEPRAISGPPRADPEPELDGPDPDDDPDPDGPAASPPEAEIGGGHPDHDELLAAAVLRMQAGIQKLCTAPPLQPADAEPEPEDEPDDGGAGNGAAGSGRGNGSGASHAGAANGGATGTAATDPELGPYIYRDARGNPHAKVVRTPNSSSRFTQQHWTGNAWRSGMPEHKLPYRLPELLAAGPAAWACITEGEKDAVNVAKLGFVATTNPNGAKGWKSAKLIPYFAHLKRFVIFEDNDEAGRERTKRIAKALRIISASEVRVVSFPELPEGGDVSDWLAQDRSRGHAELLARIEAAKARGAAELESVCADDVEMHAIDWLWSNRFAIGKIGVIAGLPDEGKGLTLCYIAGRITRGQAWPIAEGRSPLGNVVILSAEEDPSDSLVPRLKAAGVDLKRVHLIKMVRDLDEDGQPQKRMFSLVTDLERLRQKIIEVGNVAAIMIDPITAYLGVDEVDSYRDTDVRAVLGPLKELAEEMRAAVISVMHFNKKVDITNALLRVSNSLAFVGLPRHVYAVITDIESGLKLFVRAKNNDAAASDNQTLAFHIEVAEVGFDARLDKEIRAPFIVWEPDYVDVTANEAMQAASENKSPGGRDKAKKFVLDMLAGSCEVLADDIKGAAEANGLSWRTINRAKDELKEKDGINIVVDKDRSTPKGKWFWKLEKED